MHAAHTSIHPEAPIVVLRSIFQRYDEDHDGELSLNEFGNALEDLGINDEMEQRALFALADSNNSNTVRFEDFVKLVQSNGFELILSSRQDYEFVIETYRTFQQYDENGDGQITWDEFYYYLSRHGYSHQHISQYWYYMDQENKLVISFEAFWKGFKAQAEAIKYHQIQHKLNKQITAPDPEQEQHSKHNLYSRVMHNDSLFESHSWNQADKNNIFLYMKSKLKPTPQKKSHFDVQVGRVLDDEQMEKKSPLLMVSEQKQSDTISEAADEETFGQEKDSSVSIPPEIEIAAAVVRPMRLPDIMDSPQTPLRAIISPLVPRQHRLTITLLSPIYTATQTATIRPAAYAMKFHPNFNVKVNVNATKPDHLEYEHDIMDPDMLTNSSYVSDLAPNYSNEVTPATPSPNHLSPSTSNAGFHFVHFPSLSECSSYDDVDNDQLAQYTPDESPIDETLPFECSNVDEKIQKKRGKVRKNKKRKKKRKGLKLEQSVSENLVIDRTPVLRPRNSAKYVRHKKHAAVPSLNDALSM